MRKKGFIVILTALVSVVMLQGCISFSTKSDDKKETSDRPSDYLLPTQAIKSNDCSKLSEYDTGIADLNMSFYNAFELNYNRYHEAPFVEFSLEGKYSKLLFIAGTKNSDDSEKGVLGVFGDGRKLMEKLFDKQSVPEQFEVDVTGVQVLRFERLTTGEALIIVGEMTLWEEGKQAHPTKKLSKAEAKPTQLVADLLPYYVAGSHALIGPQELTRDRWEAKMSINGTEYTSGINMSAHMKLIGVGKAASIFNLGGQFTQLQFIEGPISSAGATVGSGWLTVIADDKIVYEYECKENDIARKVTIPIKGCKRLCIESQNTDGSLNIGVANIMVYPEESEPVPGLTKPFESSLTSDSYHELPDVCPLVRNIKPYALTGKVTFEDNIYDGRSSYRTFSMGGVKFNEGIILNSATNAFNDNTRSTAVFLLGGEFDYISFTTGWVSKCGVLKNDTLRVYADDNIVFNMPIISTLPNQHYKVAINKCQRLTFEKRGIQSLTHPVFGVADIVVYRGEPVDNNLFEHPQPDLPKEVDLIDLGAPYIHYVSGWKDKMNETFHDGSTQKEYFELNGNRIYKGFLLQTSVHFDMEMGALGGAGGTAVAVGGMGASIMMGSVGSATISAVCPFGALLLLAAGGTGCESSCAAFNAFEAYDEMTFTVAPYQPRNERNVDTLLIGGNGEVIKTILMRDNMQPTNYTVDLKRCGQLMFWMPCGKDTSAPYLVYDIKLRRKS